MPDFVLIADAVFVQQPARLHIQILTQRICRHTGMDGIASAEGEPGCLHQVPRRFQSPAGFGGGAGRDASYFFRGFPFALVRFRNSCLRFPASSLRFRFAVFGFITEKPKKPRGSLLRA